MAAADPQETLTVSMARRQVSERSGRTTEGLTANHLAKADLQAFIDISLIWPGNQSFGMQEIENAQSNHGAVIVQLHRSARHRVLSEIGDGLYGKT